MKATSLHPLLQKQVSEYLDDPFTCSPELQKFLEAINMSYRFFEEESRKSVNEKCEEALRNSEARYKSMVERSTEIIYTVNEQGYFTYVNPMGERITGYTQDELTHMRYIELVREDKKEETEHFYKEQRMKLRQSTYYEFPIITKSGDEVWIGQSVQLFVAPGGVPEFTSMAINITDRINYENTIHLQKKKYRSIIDNMNLGLLEVDLEERIRYVNPGFLHMSGYSEEELIGKKASDIFMNEQQGDLVREKQKLRSQGVSDMYEITVKQKNGRQRWWMVSGAPNYDEKGKHIGSIGIHLDITQQKEMERELEHARSRAEDSSKAKEAFLANMSHEIRTPLNAIIGMIRELKKESLSPQQTSHVRSLSVASGHLLSVLNNVLDLSKIEAGELQLEQLHFDLADTIKDVTSILQSKADEKNIYLKIESFASRKKNTCVISDPSRFRQVLLNLAGNAIKFTDKGGVTISYRITEQAGNLAGLHISVSDTGVGMDEQYVKNIFHKFSQEDSSTSRKYGGSGLGMPITRELVQLMNGTISVSSKKNEGTCIELQFLLPAGDPSKVVTDKTDALPEKLQPLELLLVEDNEFNRRIAMHVFSGYPCTITQAHNGQEAIEILSAGKSFDVILMDLQMPVMDGFAAVEYIRQTLHIQTPVIALTANAFKSELEKCISAGMNDYVTKPFEERHLMSLIYKLANSAKKEEQHSLMVKYKAAEKPYSLSKLMKLSGNDADYVKKMSAIFASQCASSVSEINQALRTNDAMAVSAIVHRLIPGIIQLEVNELLEVSRFVELETKKGVMDNEVLKQVQVCCEVLQRVCDSIEADLGAAA